jgi:hypothetical protein
MDMIATTFDIARSVRGMETGGAAFIEFTSVWELVEGRAAA